MYEFISLIGGLARGGCLYYAVSTLARLGLRRSNRGLNVFICTLVLRAAVRVIMLLLSLLISWGGVIKIRVIANFPIDWQKKLNLEV